MSMPMVAQVRDFSKSRGYAKLLLLTIASHVNPRTGDAFPSLETLARETTLSKPTVIKLLGELERRGELAIQRGHGRGHSNCYRVTMHHEAPPERSAEDEDDQPKGKPTLYLLPLEKVKEGTEKVKSPPEKGKAWLSSKEVLRTSKEFIERGASRDEERCAGYPKSNHTTLAQSNCRRRNLASIWRSTLYQSSVG
jgi:DNA-binding transcriptional MocR family regulator